MKLINQTDKEYNRKLDNSFNNKNTNCISQFLCQNHEVTDKKEWIVFNIKVSLVLVVIAFFSNSPYP